MLLQPVLYACVVARLSACVTASKEHDVYASSSWIHILPFSFCHFLMNFFPKISLFVCFCLPLFFVSFSLSWSWSRRDACSWRLDIIWRKVVSESDLQTSACCPSVVIYWIRSQIRRTASQKSDKIAARATCSYVVYIIVSGTHTVL